MSETFTLTLSAEIQSKLDEWIQAHVEFRPTREEALVAFIQERLSPLAMATSTGQFQMAQRWNVGLAQLPAGSRPCLIMSPAEGAGMMMLLDDKQSVDLAQQLLETVKDRSPGPAGIRQ